MKGIKLPSKPKFPKNKTPSLSDIFSSLKQSRCLSANQNPYEIIPKPSNSKQKPRILTSTNPKIKIAKKPESKHKSIEKKRLQKPSKNLKSQKIIQVKDNKLPLVAPKVYEYQIFKDIYDLKGNHERILDTSQSSLESNRDYSLVDIAALDRIYEKNDPEDEISLGPSEDLFFQEAKICDEGNQNLLEKFNEFNLDEGGD